MLLNFSFQNYRSYRAAQQFSMERTKSAQKHESAKWPRNDVSVITGIYGGNASGKSAFLDAARFVSEFVMNGFTQKFQLNEELRPFLLDVDSRNHPTCFLIDFIAPDDERYQYEFDVTRERVLFEELRKFNGARSSRLYQREYSEESSEYKYVYGRQFHGSKKLYEQITRPETLMLSALHAANCKIIEQPFLEFSKRFGYFYAQGYEAELSHIKEELKEHTGMGRALQAVMSSAGLGINVIEAKDALDLLYEASSASNNSRAGEFEKLTSGIVSLTHPELPREEREALVKKLVQDQPSHHSELVFSHAGLNGYVGEFHEADESNGTLAALAFFSMALRMLSRRSVALVDEIDTSLHPLYVEELVRLFQDPLTNPYQSQLIFTTHDVSLISRTEAGRSCLDRDQIWLVEKNSAGESTLYPLTEVKSRAGENYGKNYLNGIYGAAPQPSFHQAFASAVELISEDSKAYQVVKPIGE